jgi:hypothetical protein
MKKTFFLPLQKRIMRQYSKNIIELLKQKNDNNIFSEIKLSKELTENLQIQLLEYFSLQKKLKHFFETMEIYYQNNKQTPTIHFSRKVLKIYETERKYDQMIEYFENVMLKSHENISINIWGKIIGICFLNVSKTSKGEFLFNLMKKKKIEPNEVILSIMMKGYIKINRIDKCVSILFQHLKCGMKVDPFNLLLHEYFKRKEMDKVNELLNIVEENEIKFDKITRETFLFGLSHNGMIEEALEQIEIMKEENITLEEDHFGSILSNLKDSETFLFYKEKIFQIMEEENVEITSNSYSRLLRIMFHNGEYSVLQDMVEEMKQRNLKINTKWVTILIKHYLENDKILSVNQLLSNIKDIYLLNDLKIYNLILSYHSKKSPLEVGENFFKIMVESGIQLDNLSIFYMMNLYNRFQQYDNSIELFNKMKDLNIYPTLSTYR